MKNYLQLLRAIKERGVETSDRTGTGTLTLPGYHYTCPLYMDNDGIIHNFPLLTTKKVSLKSVFEELMWKLQGDTNIRYLLEHNNHIWTEWPFQKWLKKTGQLDKIQMWADEEKTRYSDEWIQKKAEFEQKILNDSDFCSKWGNLGKTYGYQFRNFGALDMDINIPKSLKKKFSSSDMEALCLANPGKDQLMEAVHLIKENPESRRIIISLWNPNELDEESTLLPPCPAFYQFFANEDGMLHLNLYQRSCDTFLGIPYNTAQDALFLCMMAQVTGRKPGVFNHMFGDAHIYLNHLDLIECKKLLRIFLGVFSDFRAENLLYFDLWVYLEMFILYQFWWRNLFSLINNSSRLFVGITTFIPCFLNIESGFLVFWYHCSW